MKTGQQPRSNKWRIVALLVGIAGIVTALIFGSMRSVQAECSLCVEFNGMRECRTGLGPTQAQAASAAQRAACAVMAFGMAESINCSNVPPQQRQCSGGS